MKSASLKILTLSATAGILFAACGEQNGGNIIPNPNIDSANYVLSNPLKGATNACTNPLFLVDMKDSTFCNKADDFNKSIRLYRADDGARTPIPLTGGTQVSGTSGSACRFEFQVNTAKYGHDLDPSTKYYFGLMSGEAQNVSSSVDTQFADFTTGPQGTKCFDGTAFIPRYFYGPIGSSLMRSNIDQLPTALQVDPNGKIISTINWGGLGGSLLGFFQQSLVNQILGFGNGGANPILRVEFNREPQKYSARSNIALFSVPAGLENSSGLLKQVDLTKDCPKNSAFGDNSCIDVDPANTKAIIIRAPKGDLRDPDHNGEGETKVAMTYYLIIGHALVATDGTQLGDAVEKLDAQKANSANNSSSVSNTRTYYSYATTFRVDP